MAAEQPWEGRIVEAPQMVRASGHYWLFYSGNWFNRPTYGIGVAECQGPAGPCRKPSASAWLSSNRQGAGPGESFVYEDAKGWWILYAPHYTTDAGKEPRPVARAAVVFDDDGPLLATR